MGSSSVMFLQSPGTKSAQGITQDIFAHGLGQEVQADDGQGDGSVSQSLQLLQFTAEIFTFAKAHLQDLSASYLPGSQNSVGSVEQQVLAPLRMDAESEVFGGSVHSVGSTQYRFDGNSIQLPLFFSHYFCPQAVAQDSQWIGRVGILGRSTCLHQQL